MVNLTNARTPDGLRLYAVGDIHGRLDLLREMHGRIATDLVRRPCRRFRIIHLGDYIDRGPDSAGVVEHLADFVRDGDSVCLAGNHDLYLTTFLDDPHEIGEHWLRFGGDAALESWGVATTEPGRGPRTLGALQAALQEALPDRHRAFFASLPFTERHGDYLFVHAGLRPGVPLHKQKTRDLVTIREPFLGHAGDHGVVVVHGHTVVEAPEVRPNRVGLDTKAYASGVLSCLVLEEADKGLLLPGGYRPLAMP